jgi:hypothetical protein
MTVTAELCGRSRVSARQSAAHGPRDGGYMNSITCEGIVTLTESSVVLRPAEKTKLLI